MPGTNDSNEGLVPGLTGVREEGACPLGRFRSPIAPGSPTHTTPAPLTTDSASSWS